MGVLNINRFSVLWLSDNERYPFVREILWSAAIQMKSSIS